MFCFSLSFQLVTALQFLSGFSKLLQSCILADKELIGQMDFMKRLLSTLVAVLMLDIKGLGENLMSRSNESKSNKLQNRKSTTCKFYSVLLL